MPQIGPLEILVVSVLALIVFGPEKLPDLARSAGKGLNQLRTMASDVKAEFDLGAEELSTENRETSDDPQAPAEPVATTATEPEPNSI